METGAIAHSEIDVTITDQTGARLPGVTGVLNSTVTGERVEISDANGTMVFGALPPGAYDLIFTLEGFKTVAVDVTLHDTNEHDPLEIVMQMAHP